ncbi:hypothetical protein BT69DRAFT_1210182 [Atractiella rhizophila]|nr:hypothetical protein BT69DRAFT_1210182 [Atractiella rhizophila]
MKSGKRGCVEASKYAASATHFGEVYGARCIWVWARHYEETGELPVSDRGLTACKDLQPAEKLCADMCARLREQKWNMDPTKICNCTLSTLIPQEHHKYVQRSWNNRCRKDWKHYLEISVFILSQWLYVCAVKREPDIFCSGHERPDVVHYRQNIFIQTWESFLPRMCQYNIDDIEKEINKDLPSGVTEVVAVFHDESTFTANDSQHHSQCLDGQSRLRKKDAGREIHRFDFICPTYG